MGEKERHHSAGGTACLPVVALLLSLIVLATSTPGNLLPFRDPKSLNNAMDLLIHTSSSSMGKYM